MRLLLTISLLMACGGALAESVRMLVQSSPLAGSQYHQLGTRVNEMRVGDPLSLVREPDNRHDRRAVRVEWRGHKIGYVPRAENRTLATAMDDGERISARISKLHDNPDPWQRVEFEVFVHL